MSERVTQLLRRLWNEDLELGQWHGARVAAEWLRGCGITHPSELWIGFERGPGQPLALTLPAAKDGAYGE